jgi:hypothetical protein
MEIANDHFPLLHALCAITDSFDHLRRGLVNPAAAVSIQFDACSR